MNHLAPHTQVSIALKNARWKCCDNKCASPALQPAPGVLACIHEVSIHALLAQSLPTDSRRCDWSHQSGAVS
eukprot:3000066-Amphidinium_carterae.1